MDTRTTMEGAEHGVRPSFHEIRRRTPGYQAYTALYLGYAALPIIAGLDKFAHALTDWNQYLAPIVTSTLGITATTFMYGVGAIEVAAGCLVAARPRLGAAVVGLWLCGIIGNLLLIPGYFDIALRDFGLAVGAFALWRMSAQYE